MPPQDSSILAKHTGNGQDCHQQVVRLTLGLLTRLVRVKRPAPHRFVVAVISDRHQQVDGSDQLAASITQRSWIGSKWNPCAVRALRLRRHAADLPVLFDGHRHWALIVGQLRPVGPEQPPGSAPPGTAQLWTPAPQIGRSPVVEGEVTVGIGKIDRGRQCLEQIAGQDPAVSKHLLNWLTTKGISNHY